MITSFEEFAKRVDTLCLLNISNTKLIQSVMIDAEKNHDIPMRIVNNVLTQYKKCIDESPLVGFAIMECLAEKELPKYFTEKEIAQFTKERYESETISFPMRIPALEVFPDQWIAVLNVRTIMALSNAQLINYNENVQRIVKRLVNNDAEYFQIDVNRNSVKEIANDLLTQKYIPDAITLNIPEDSDFDYQDGALIINSINAFDITDGYHRYLAMSQACVSDSSFDYPFIVQFTCFSDEKGRSFINQTDKKNHMSKIAVSALDIDSFGSQVIRLLNKGVLQDKIKRSRGIIKESDMIQYVQALYNPKTFTRADVIKAKNEIYAWFETLLEEKPDLLNKEVHSLYILSVLFMYKYHNDDTTYDTIEKFYQIIKKNQYNLLRGKIVKKLEVLYDKEM